MKRIFDVLISFCALVFLMPLLLVLAVWIIIDSPGGAFYRQVRVGKGGVDFWLYKFRSMRPGSDLKGLLTVGGRDARLTRAGYFLRASKLDELPQLFNVLKGDMSIVGPRPEVRKYVELYSDQQRKVLDVRPGLSDYASIEYIDENEILGLSENPEKAYIEQVMPHKLELAMRYVDEQSFWTDLRIIGKTLRKLLRF